MCDKVVANEAVRLSPRPEPVLSPVEGSKGSGQRGTHDEARRIASEAGWDESRQDRMAVAITANLNSFVPSKHFGAEAHFMRVGGLVEVLAQEWKLHPDNLAEILGRYPRAGFAADALQHVQREVKRHPNCRFACLDPLFPILVRRSSFSLDIH